MLKFVDSFDHYQSADLGMKWTNVSFSPEITAGAGSCGSQGCTFNAFDQLIKGIAFGSDTVGFGHWLKVTLFTTSVTQVYGGIGGATYRHLYITRTYDGSLHVMREDSTGATELGVTAPDVIRTDDAYFVECKALIHASAGTVLLKVNGVQVLSLTGKNTKSDRVTTRPTSLWFGTENGNGNAAFVIDDVYAFDTVAGVVTDLTGPVRAEWLKPDGVGADVADFSLVGAATQWQAVRDASGPDGDTSYVQSATVNHKHTSTFEGTGLPAGSIFGVQTNLIARVTDAGFRGVKPLIIQGADYLGTEQAPGASYRDLHEMFETDPATGVAWLIAGVNSAEFGVKVTT